MHFPGKYLAPVQKKIIDPENGNLALHPITVYGVGFPGIIFLGLLRIRVTHKSRPFPFFFFFSRKRKINVPNIKMKENKRDYTLM